MLYKYSYILLGLSIAALALLAVFHGRMLWIYVASGFAVVSFIFSVISVLKPMKAVENGIYLLREQDFSSRLRHVRQPDADKLVDFFNKAMETMKQERLKNQEYNRFLQLLIDASPMGIAILGFNGNVVSANNSYRKFLTPELEREIEALNQDEEKTVRLGHSNILRISKLWFMDNGFRRQFVLIEQMSEAIMEAERKMFNLTVRTLGHEVNNTLGSVMSVLETIINTDALNEYHDIVECCRDRCRSLSDFVKGYASIVKIPDPRLKRIELNGYLKEILPFLKEVASEEIEIVSSYHDHPVYIQADAALLERVMVNIVKNAVESIRSSGKTGRIEIHAEPGELRITDDGSGVTEDFARHPFTPFFTTKPDGHGLGLMLTAEILRRHHFDFSLTTASSHTTFKITFAKTN